MIRSEGFDTSLNVEQVWGRGVYTGTDAKTKKFYERVIRERGYTPVTVEFRANVKNIARIDADKHAHTLSQLRGSDVPRWAARQLGVLNDYNAELKSIQKSSEKIKKAATKKYKLGSDDWRRETRRLGIIDQRQEVAEALTRALENSGYDALEIVNENLSSDIGGQQLVVFNQQNVVAIK